jgi:hypothetical protein
MKKNQTANRKLTLNRDTLRSLNTSALQKVEGAGTAACDDSLNYSCDPASVRICPASRWIC